MPASCGCSVCGTRGKRWCSIWWFRPPTYQRMIVFRWAKSAVASTWWTCHSAPAEPVARRERDRLLEAVRELERDRERERGHGGREQEHLRHVQRRVQGQRDRDRPDDEEHLARRPGRPGSSPRGRRKAERPTEPAGQEGEVGHGLPAHRDEGVQQPHVQVLVAVPRAAPLAGLEAGERQRVDVGIVVGDVRVGVMGQVLGRPHVRGAADQVERVRREPVDDAARANSRRGWRRA